MNKEMTVKTDFNLDFIKEFKITTEEDFKHISEVRKAVKEMLAEIDKALDEQVKSAYKAYKTAMNKKKENRQPWEEREEALKSIMDDFVNKHGKIKTPGVTYRTKRNFEVTDPEELFAFAIEHPGMGLLKIDDVKVKKLMDVIDIPGIKPIEIISSSVS